MTPSITAYTSATSPSTTNHAKVVLLFWADWHEDSVLLLNGILPALASATSGVSFGSVQADECPEWSDTYGVTVVPTLVLVNTDGVLVQKLEGDIEIADITTAVQRLATMGQGSVAMDAVATPTPATTATITASTSSLETRLKNLIHSSQIMLFIKGTPTAPKCGFSRQVVELFDKEHISFGSFDILSDDDVRQGLKTYSDWPTYPQVYCKGELIGGLDILQEMAADESTSLADQLGVTPTAGMVIPLHDRLKQLVTKSRIMLFMKGLPSAPKCGFSRQIVELLEQHQAEFDAFNILDDEEVRQGLKTFSDWPTFPQLYVDGDLIGGLDIVREMVESGDFADLVKGGQ